MVKSFSLQVSPNQKETSLIKLEIHNTQENYQLKIDTPDNTFSTPKKSFNTSKIPMTSKLKYNFVLKIFRVNLF